MKKALANALRYSLSLCLLLPVFAMGQIGTLTERPNVNINPNVNGYLEYLPVGYDPGGTTRYPLIVYIQGLNSHGEGPDAELDKLWTCGNVPHEQQQPRSCGNSSSWVDQYTVNGQSYRFVIITPQFKRSLDANPPTSAEMNSLLDFVAQNYRVDTTRVYLMGSSQGGGVVWTYTSESSRNANRVAAFVAFGSVVIPTQERANILKYAGTKVWGIHFAQDPSVPPSFTSDFVDFYNNPPAPPVPAKKTMVPGNGHVVWPGYLGRFTNVPDASPNVYEWVLQYSRTATRVFAGEDQEIALPANSVQLAGQGTGPNGTVGTRQWSQVMGPAGAVISNPTAANPTVSNLAYGVYVFRLTITDNGGGTASDEVAITVNPAATRYQAENFVASGGGGITNNDPTTDPDVPNDPDGGRRVNSINGYNGADYMDYVVNVPATAVYRVRFRTGSFYGACSFEIRTVPGNQVLGSVRIYPSGYDNYQNTYANLSLVAGDNTIRIISTGPAGGQPWEEVWYMNWFEIIDNPGVTLGPLPVRFGTISADCAGSRVVINWKASQEQNVARYLVQRSANGRDWTDAGTVAARGGTAEQQYDYTDLTPGGWYRVVAVDQDGRRSISDVLRAPCSRDNALSLFPNPARDKANLTLTLESAASVRILLVDARGRTVRQQSLSLPRGTSSHPLDLSSFAAGSYTLIAEWNGESRSVKLVKN